MDLITLSTSKQYTNQVALGLSDVTVKGTTVTFTLNNGETDSITLPIPADGKSIINVTIDTDGSLLCTLSDGSVIDAGTVPAVKGDKGDKGDTGEVGPKGDSYIITESDYNAIAEIVKNSYTDGDEVSY